MIKKIFLVLILVLLPVTAFADGLVLVKGKGVPICEAHLKNLQSLSLNEMVCKRDESYPEANGITMPKWERLDLRENKELVRKIIKFFTEGDQFAEMKIMDLDDNAFNEFSKLTGLRYNPTYTLNALYKTSVDIDNDGKAEKVLLYQDAICMYTRAYSRPLFVLDEAKNQIDVTKTEMLMQNISKSGYDIKAKAIESIYRLYGVFSYKNKTYFDKWFIYDLTLSVYYQSKDKVNEICKYKYKQTQKNKED